MTFKAVVNMLAARYGKSQQEILLEMSERSAAKARHKRIEKQIKQDRLEAAMKQGAFDGYQRE